MTAGPTGSRRPAPARTGSARPGSVRPPERSRPGGKATLHVLASGFVQLPAADRDAAVDALAALLAARRNGTGPVSQPDATME